MKIYTRSGDSGQTGMLGGHRVSKSDLQIRTIGDVDELNACLGMALSFCSDVNVAEQIETVQHELFSIGALLATVPLELSENTSSELEKATKRLESEMDHYQGLLPELNQFILPGGDQAASAVHVCRTVCRRAERGLIGQVQAMDIAPPSELLAYLNRLSDWLFVMARMINHLREQKEIIWTKPF